MGLGEIFANVATGGATGLVGLVINAGAGLLKSKADLKVKAEENFHAQASQKLSLDAMKIEADMLKAGAKIEWNAKAEIESSKTSAAVAQAGAEALKAAHSSDQAKYGGGWVDSFRGMTRPTLTFISIFFIIWLSWDTRSSGNVEAYNQIVNFATWAAGTIIVFWFGGRGMQGKK